MAGDVAVRRSSAQCESAILGLDLEMLETNMGKCVLPGRRCRRSVLAVVHDLHWWSLATGQALNDGPNVHQKGLARFGSLATVMVRFEGASKGRNAAMQKCRNAGEERAREFL